MSAGGGTTAAVGCGGGDGAAEKAFGVIALNAGRLADGTTGGRDVAGGGGAAAAGGLSSGQASAGAVPPMTVLP